MPPVPSQPETDRERKRALLESVWNSIKGHLENEKHRIYQEITSYPRPIPACDLQFNSLLKERASISQELERMREAARESLNCRDPLSVFDEFIRSSSHLDGGAKETLQSSLKEGLAKLES